jgi:hypothetical protein
MSPPKHIRGKRGERKTLHEAISGSSVGAVAMMVRKVFLRERERERNDGGEGEVRPPGPRTQARRERRGPGAHTCTLTRISKHQRKTLLFPLSFLLFFHFDQYRKNEIKLQWGEIFCC